MNLLPPRVIAALAQPRVIAALATFLWTGGVEGIGHLAVGYVCVILAAATCATVIAAFWAIALSLHDDERLLLLGALADATRPRARSTAPMPIRLVR